MTYSHLPTLQRPHLRQYVSRSIRASCDAKITDCAVSGTAISDITSVSESNPIERRTARIVFSHHATPFTARRPDRYAKPRTTNAEGVTPTPGIVASPKSNAKLKTRFNFKGKRDAETYFISQLHIRSVSFKDSASVLAPKPSADAANLLTGVLYRVSGESSAREKS